VLHADARLPFRLKPDVTGRRGTLGINRSPAQDPRAFEVVPRFAQRRYEAPLLRGRFAPPQSGRADLEDLDVSSGRPIPVPVDANSNAGHCSGATDLRLISADLDSLAKRSSMMPFTGRSSPEPLASAGSRTSKRACSHPLLGREVIYNSC